MQLRADSPQDRVAPVWRIDVSDRAEKSYLLELTLRDRMMKVYARTKNEWAKKYAEEILQMPFGHLRELKITAIKCMCNLRDWQTNEGRQLRAELRNLLEKIQLR